MSDAAPLDSNSNQLDANDIGATTVGEAANIPFSADECFCIEVFSGSAGLTAEMRLIFPTSFGIDHKVTRPKSKVISLDLQNEHNQQLLFEWSSKRTCLWIHFGVPCGTASRAREIRMAKDHHGPLPMRSDLWPDGLPPWQLSRNAVARLRAANRLYHLTVRVISKLHPHTVWSVENPSRSHLWQTSYFQQLLNTPGVFRFEYHMCMFGGLRFKRTDLLMNCGSFANAIRVCDNRHTHLPFSVQNNRFDTSLEAEYPKDFCRALVQVVQSHFNSMFGWKLGLQQQPKRSQQAALASGSQPLKSIQPLVQEFSHIEVIKHVPPSFECPLDSKRCFSACVQFGVQSPLFIHKGTKLLRRTIIKGGQRNRATDSEGLEEAMMNPILGSPTNQGNSQSSQLPCQHCGEKIVVDLCTGQHETLELACGVYRSPEDFVKECSSISHPKDIFSGVSDEVRHAINMCASRPSHEVVVHRMQWLGKYIQAARDLSGDEKLLMDSLPLEKRRILDCKRIKLPEKMIRDEDYPDKTLPQDIANGFSLVGHAPSSSGVLPSKIEPATLAVSELEEHAVMGRAAVRYSTVSSGDMDLDKELWLKTMGEVDKGWLVGPLKWDDLPKESVVSKRFPLMQGNKLRPIDDYSRSQVNSAISIYDQVTTDGVDVVAAMVSFYMKQRSSHDLPTELQGGHWILVRLIDSCALQRSRNLTRTLQCMTPSPSSPVLSDKSVCLLDLKRRSMHSFVVLGAFSGLLLGACGYLSVVTSMISF